MNHFRLPVISLYYKASRGRQPLFCFAGGPAPQELNTVRPEAKLTCWKQKKLHCTHEIPTDFLLSSCCRDTLSASANRFNYSHVFFVETPRRSWYIVYLRHATIFVFVLAAPHLSISVLLQYTGPHLTTVLRALAFTDRQSFPAYDRRISELM